MLSLHMYGVILPEIVKARQPCRFWKLAIVVLYHSALACSIDTILQICQTFLCAIFVFFHLSAFNMTAIH